MDFTLSPEIEACGCACVPSSRSMCCRSKPTGEFLRARDIPHERLAPVRVKAKKAGLWAPQSPKEYGGMDPADGGLGGDLQEAARSIFGPVVFNCGARRRQHDGAGEGRHPRPEGELAGADRRGKVRSAFAMTEPHPGGGSDPA